ncbi:hypothetical protein F5Y14DRAFT_20382 [Nemania sp. NC0429]|nr:hypothetical protein F5Y14DRAFT_20382 [Nemania sp. NC0429]
MCLRCRAKVQGSDAWTACVGSEFILAPARAACPSLGDFPSSQNPSLEIPDHVSVEARFDAHTPLVPFIVDDEDVKHRHTRLPISDIILHLPLAQGCLSLEAGLRHLSRASSTAKAVCPCAATRYHQAFLLGRLRQYVRLAWMALQSTESHLRRRALEQVPGCLGYWLGTGNLLPGTHEGPRSQESPSIYLTCAEEPSSHPSKGTGLFSKDLSTPEVGVELGKHRIISTASGVTGVCSLAVKSENNRHSITKNVSNHVIYIYYRTQLLNSSKTHGNRHVLSRSTYRCKLTCCSLSIPDGVR